MSHYLSNGSRQLPNVDVVTGGEIAALEGEDGGARSGHAGATAPRARRTRRPVAPSLLLHRRRAQYRLAAASGLKLDARGFVLHRRGRRRRSPAARDQPPRRVRGRRRARRTRSSGSPPRSATARRSSPRSTNISPMHRCTARQATRQSSRGIIILETRRSRNFVRSRLSHRRDNPLQFGENPLQAPAHAH